MLRQRRGTSYLGINLKDVRSLPIPVPPLSAQSDIESHLDELRSKIEAVEQLQLRTADELEAMIPAVLDRAFNGDL
jgi:type I restriction enzyme, S subunit